MPSTEPSTTVREATSADEPFLWRMLYLAANWRNEEKSEQEALSEPKIARYVEGWGRRGDAGVIGVIDGEPIGAAWYRLFTRNARGYGFVDEKTPELSMAVQKEYRRAGLGRLLLTKVLDLANTNGYPAVSLSVEPENPARKLYEKEDFKVVDKSGEAWTMVRDSNPHDL